MDAETIKLAGGIILIILIGLAAAFHWRLFPNQYRCMYDEHGDVDRCDRQCRFCRENLDKL